jgi:predicted RNA-binding protein with PIN domain
MALLIDGYNLLHVTGIFGAAGAGTELHRSRLALLDFLAASISDRDRSQTTIVFDATGAPPGLPNSATHEGMFVYFARRHANADEMIERLLDECQAPKSLTVVSSDHRIQRAARQHGASYIDSDKWFAELQAARRERDLKIGDSLAKPDGQSPEEISYWVDEFEKGATKARRAAGKKKRPKK